MKFKKLWTLVALSLLATMISCSDDQVTTVTRPIVTTGPTMVPGVPGIVGTFSGEVQSKDHKRSGTLTISITKYDLFSGQLTGTLNLTGFKNCYAKGIFPDPHQTNNYDNHYIPSRGFGSIAAIGNQPGSRSFLYFNRSDDFNKGLELNGISEDLGFFNGTQWCLLIDPVVLKRQ